MIVAVQQQFAEYGRSVQQILATSGENSPPLLHLMSNLINEMVAHISTSFIIVLDDLHRVSDKTIHKLLDYLLEHIPPNIHLIITTRHDPPLRLAQLRVRGQLAEFRLDALRFSDKEVNSLFNEVMGLSLSADDLQLIHKRTEGWAAGVRLLTLSLPRLASANARSDLIQHLSASQRFLFDYLMEEVLNQLDANARDFLLKTSILAELPPTLCNAVTQRNDADRMLDTLYRQNLFLVVSETAVPSAEPIYRYHALFAQFLQRHLRQHHPDLYNQLHLKAGESQPDPDKAIHHFLQAKAWQRAIYLIKKIGHSEVEHHLIHAKTIGWINALPSNLQQSDPWLQLLVAVYAGQKGNLVESLEQLQSIRIHFQEKGEIEGEFICITRIFSMMGNQNDPSLLPEALALIETYPELVKTHHRLFIYLNASWAYALRGEWKRVDQYLSVVLDLIRQNGRFYSFFATSIGSQFLFANSGIAPIKAIADQILQQIGDGETLIHGGAYGRLSSIYLYQAQLEQAHDFAQRTRKIVRAYGGLAWQEGVIDNIILVTHLARGNYVNFHHVLNKRWSEIMHDNSLTPFAPHYDYLRGTAYWHQQQYDKLETILARMIENRSPWHDGISRAELMMQAWLAIVHDKFSDAEQYLQQAVQLHTRLRETTLISHPRLNLACLYWLWHKKTEDTRFLCLAQAALDVLLTEVHQRQMPGLLLQSGRVAKP